MPNIGQRAPAILPWSLHKGVGWETKFKMMERWYQRTKNSDAKEDVADFLFVFFQSCFQLREWLELTSGLAKTDLEILFSEHVELKICRDLCNVTKHFSISRPSQKYELSVLQEYCNPNSPYHQNCWFGGDAKLIVVTDNKNYDALELAHTCLNIWRDFLSEKGLLK